MEEIREIVAENISALRNDKKMTQLELAEVLNYSDKAVSKWERGESIPDVITLKAMADLFGVTVDYIITRHNPGEKRKGAHTARNNHIFITLLAVAGVWILGTCIYSIASMFKFYIWETFVVCVPISLIVMLVFNSVWGKPKLNFAIISALLWSMLATLFIIFNKLTEYDVWLIFLIGIPSQIAIGFSSALKKPKNKSKEAVKRSLMYRRRGKKDEENVAEQPEANKNIQ